MSLGPCHFVTRADSCAVVATSKLWLRKHKKWQRGEKSEIQPKLLKYEAFVSPVKHFNFMFFFFFSTKLRFKNRKVVNVERIEEVKREVEKSYSPLGKKSTSGPSLRDNREVASGAPFLMAI